MSCDLTAGRLEPCKDGIGGVKAVYFLNYESSNPSVDAGDLITDIDDGAATPGAATAYKYDVKGASSLVQNIMASRENGTVYFEQVLNLSLKKLTSTDNKELKLMAYGRPRIVIHDNAGNAYMVGTENGADVTGGSAMTGQAFGDMYGYTLVLTAQEQTLANFLTGATTADPFAGMTTAVTIVEGT